MLPDSYLVLFTAHTKSAVGEAVNATGALVGIYRNDDLEVHRTDLLYEIASSATFSQASQHTCDYPSKISLTTVLSGGGTQDSHSSDPIAARTRCTLGAGAITLRNFGHVPDFASFNVDVWAIIHQRIPATMWSRPMIVRA